MEIIQAESAENETEELPGQNEVFTNSLYFLCCSRAEKRLHFSTGSKAQQLRERGCGLMALRSGDSVCFCESQHEKKEAPSFVEDKEAEEGATIEYTELLLAVRIILETCS